MDMSGPYDAAIIDLDGTMVDTLGDFVAAINLMLADSGLGPVPPQVVGGFIGKGGEYLVRSVLLAACGDSARAESLFAASLPAFRAHYLSVNGRHASVFPGVEQGLTAMQARGMKLACVTNKPTGAARDLLRAKGLEGFFSHVAGSDAYERIKPDPMPLLKTCEAMGTTPARTLMVGDSVNDAKAARAAGCPVVLVTYGYNHGVPVHEVDTDGFVDSLVQLELQ